MKRKDILWKGIMEELTADFLQFFFPDSVALFDLSRPVEFMDKELQELFPVSGDELSARFVDKLMKVYLKGGEYQFFLLHVEVQGYEQEGFAFRMFEYYLLIASKLYQQERRLRPVVALAIFSDSVAGFVPAYFQQEFAGTQIRYSFSTYKILA